MADQPEPKSQPTRAVSWALIWRITLRVLAIVGAALAVLVSVVLYRTCTLESRQLEVEPAAALNIALPDAAERLAQAVRIPTITDVNGPASPETFARLHALLERSFPQVHRVMKREVVADSSLLYTWVGADPSAAPVILAAHMDVVPVADESAWIHPPFAGLQADGFIWGRGTLDDKQAVLGILEAAEALIAEGFQPPRTVYLAFGHDEEIQGRGAESMAALLAQREVHAAFALDEGLAVTRGVMKAIDGPLAAVGVAEKGYLTIELVAHAEGGHSSIPPKRTAIGALARAIVRIRDRPLTASLSGPADPMLDYMAPEMPFFERMAMANRWLFGFIVLGIFESDPATEAMVRTTIAPTLTSAGTKDNVLPATASAVINFRIHPSEEAAHVMAHVKRAVADDAIDIIERRSVPPSPISDPESPAFGVVQRTIRQVFQGAVVTPGLVLGQTDGRFYEPVADHVFRFAPLDLLGEDLARLHGVNERISVEHYGQNIRFYAQLLRNLEHL